VVILLERLSGEGAQQAEGTMRRITSWMVVFIAALAGTSTALGAEVLISVNKTTQRMTVTVDGAELPCCTNLRWRLGSGCHRKAVPS
jgi:hypothetical protein